MALAIEDHAGEGIEAGLEGATFALEGEFGRHDWAVIGVYCGEGEVSGAIRERLLGLELGWGYCTG